MSVAEFIGDEVSAAGYRLCGVKVHIADRHNATSLIKRACDSASLVLIGSSTIQYLGTVELEKLMQNIMPPVLVVPDVTGGLDVPNVAALIHKQLGMLE